MFSTKEKITLTLICAMILSFCLGMHLGPKMMKNINDSADRRITQPIFDQMETDYKQMVNKWHQCSTELTNFQVLTGFETAAKYDSVHKIIEKKYEEEFLDLYKEKKALYEKKQEVLKQEHELNKQKKLHEKILSFVADNQ